MNHGTIKFWNPAKGFGFIIPDNGGHDVFVHASDVERAGFGEPYQGQKLSYEVTTDRRDGKQRAMNLQEI